MYNVSSNSTIQQWYKDAVYNPNRRLKFELYINDNLIDNAYVLDRVEIEYDTMQDGFSVGNIVYSKLSFSLYSSVIIFEMANISIFISVEIFNTSTNKYEYIRIPMGQFKVVDIESTKLQHKITAYDKYYNQLQMPFVKTKNTYNSGEILSQITSETGIQFKGFPTDVVLANEDIVTKTEDSEGNEVEERKDGTNFDNHTYASILAQVAGVCGGNIIFDREGACKLVVGLPQSDVAILPQDFTEPTIKPFTYDKKRLEITKREDLQPIKVGTEVVTGNQTLAIANPLFTTDSANRVLDIVNDISYQPISTKIMIMPLHLEPLDVISILYEDSTLKIPLMKYKLTFAGGLSGEMESFVSNQTQGGYQGSLTTQVSNLSSQVANLASLTIGSIVVGDLQAIQIKVDELVANVAKINTLVAGNLTAENFQSMNITVDKFTMQDGFITNGHIQNINASKINAGKINTSNVSIGSRNDDGEMLISDNTIQINDKNGTRIQIGKDAQGQYNLYVWDANGALMWSANGLTQDGIQDAIIRDDMVSDDANINAKKLDIESLFTQMNADGSNTLKASKILLDTEKQTLNIAFNQMTTKQELLTEKTNTLTTQLNTQQGQIDTLIKDTSITTEDGQTTLKDAYSQFVQTQNGFNLKVEEHESKFNNLQVGGRNFAQNTSSDWLGFGFVNVTPTNYCIYNRNVLIDGEVGDVLTYRLELRLTGMEVASGQTNGTVKLQGSGDVTAWNSGSFSGSSYKILSGDSNITIVGKITLSESCLKNSYWKTSLRFDNVVNGSVEVRNYMFEKGTLNSSWSPAPEDVLNSISTAKQEAIDGAVATSTTNMDSRLNSYSTTTDVKSMINISKSDIISSVSETYETKANATTKYNGLTSSINTLSTRMNSAEQKITSDAIINTVSGVYATKTELQNIQVGGVNRIPNSAPTSTSGWTAHITGWTRSLVDCTTAPQGKAIRASLSTTLATGGMYKSSITTGTWEHGEQYTISCYMRASNDAVIKLTHDAFTGTSGSNKNVTTEWQHFTTTGTYNQNASNKACTFYIQSSQSAGFWFEVHSLKVEKGNKPTDWSPAPEDTIDSITSLETRVSTAEQKITKDAIISTVSSTFVKQTDFDNMTIGGENLLPNSNFTYNLNHWGEHEPQPTQNPNATNKSISIANGGTWADPTVNTLQIRATTLPDRYGVMSNKIQLQANTEYVISGYCAGHRVSSVQVNIRDMDNNSGNISTVNYNPVSGGNSLSKYYYFEQVFTTTKNTNYAVNLYGTNFQDDGYVWFANIKLEKGNKATSWSPNPKDIETNANNYTSTQLTNYYTKIDTDSRITIATDSITSAVSKTYTTKVDFNNLTIGGENLIINSNFDFGFENWQGSTTKYYITEDNMLGYNQLDLTEAKSYQVYTKPIDVSNLIGKELTVSFDYKIIDKTQQSTIAIGYIRFFDADHESSTSQTDSIAYKTLNLSNNYVNGTVERTKVTITVPTGAKYARVGAYQSRNGNMYWSNFQLEVGNKATAWKPSSSDIILYADNSNDMLQSELNDLKNITDDLSNADSISPDMKTKLIAECEDSESVYNKLVYLYQDVMGSPVEYKSLFTNMKNSFSTLSSEVAYLKSSRTEISDSGLGDILQIFNNFYAYAEGLNEKILNSLKGITDSLSTEITQLADSVTIKINEFSSELGSINTHFIFDTDGLTIKSSADSTKYIKLDNDSLDFMDNNTKVAEITNQQLNISKATIANEMKIGNMKIKPSGSSKNGVIFVFE